MLRVRGKIVRIPLLGSFPSPSLGNQVQISYPSSVNTKHRPYWWQHTKLAVCAMAGIPFNHHFPRKLSHLLEDRNKTSHCFGEHIVFSLFEVILTRGWFSLYLEPHDAEKTMWVEGLELITVSVKWNKTVELLQRFTGSLFWHSCESSLFCVVCSVFGVELWFR